MYYPEDASSIGGETSETTLNMSRSPLEDLELHYDTVKFESAFKPGRLSDWSAGWKIPVRPQARRLPTKVIADDRGHLLPGIPRHGNPWPPFKHAYQYPRRITRRYADDVNWPPEERKRLTSWEKRSRHIPILPGEEPENKLENPSVKYSLQERRKENRRRRKKNETPSKSEVGSPLKINEYDPYSKDDQDFSHTLGYDKLTKVVDAPQRVHQDLEEYKNNCREVVKEPLEELLEKSQEMAGSKGSSRVSSPAQKKERVEKTPSPAASSPPLEVDFISAIHAKTMAQENLKHQPLPDTVDDLKIKALQMKELKELKESDRATTAVGWKSFNSPGPTQCAKIRVYRPKTGAIKKKSLLDKDFRPKTSVMFNKDVNEIDLALCWDLLPPRPEDEPRRPKHIDGSNGSAAPSVFTVVKPLTEDIILDEGKSADKKPRPKTAWEEKKRLPEPTNPSAVMDIINNNAELIDTKRKPSNTSPLGKKKSPSPPASQGSGVRSPDKFSQGSKSPDNTKENSNPNIQNGERKNSSSSRRVGSGQNRSFDSSIDSDKLSRHKHYRSSPDLPAITDKNHKHNKMMFSRPCMACEVKGSTSGSDGSRRPKSEYKMAFKAGQPGNFNGRPVTAKVAVPKPKTPFAKRSYSIGTLIPPFSLWQGTAGMEYPEHWRLASVYQHSYKPVETRKKPLIQSVFQ